MKKTENNNYDDKTKNKIMDLMNKEYNFPIAEDENLQYKLYKKREFYYNKVPKKNTLNNLSEINKYRNEKCNMHNFSLREHQILPSNYLNPDTSNPGLLLFYGLGSGKTCAAITIAEKFKPLVTKYNTKILVLVPGSLLTENWKNQLLFCTGDTYTKYQDKNVYLNETDKKRAKKISLTDALSYYRFMSYSSFYKRVLGERIIEKKSNVNNKLKVTYRKTESGKYDREVSSDRIYNLNNTLIIVEEAHNLTDNIFGESLMEIRKNSTNLKILLLSATPMKNLGDDIVKLLNFIRPLNSQIERDKIFTSPSYNHLIDIKKSGIDYLNKIANGYISYFRGDDPLLFAKRVDYGKVPKGLLFTKTIPCEMLDFQYKYYNIEIQNTKDALDRSSQAVSNFVFPGLLNSELQGYYGKSGLTSVKSQLKSTTNLEILNNKIAKEILHNEKVPKEEINNLIKLSHDEHTISGDILNIKYLKYFSIKFYTALLALNSLVYGKKGTSVSFVYSNLVIIGIELFKEVLLQNGYLEYDDNPNNYKILPETICYYCGNSLKNHNSTKIPSHVFYPSTFLVITGKASDDDANLIPEDKLKIINNVFNNVENINGKYIKIILGSKVMNEGINLKYIAEVHILDVYFNLGRVDQVVGRAIRECSHMNLVNDNNLYPEVGVYKYTVTIKNKLSSEEELYKKAELKHILIKKIERVLKENAIDCPLNYNGNIFKDEIEKYKNCIPLYNLDKNMINDINQICPSKCDYEKCEFICSNKKLNNDYYNYDNQEYKYLSKDKLDYSTFTSSIANSEINYSKKKIKELYLFGYIYTLDQIINYVWESYNSIKKEMFDKLFVFKALDEMIPVTENDFNNFKDTIIDKYNRLGYLIYINKYYIFQPFDQNENVPVYYRMNVNYDNNENISKFKLHKLSLYIYLKNTTKYKEYVQLNEEQNNIINVSQKYEYDMKYYENRDEYDIIGIIDREQKIINEENNDIINDVFKIREKREKIIEKKREIGLPTLKGAVCATAKNKEYLNDIMKKLKIKSVDKFQSRLNICKIIKDHLLELEKYSNNNITYIMIPSNHKIYPFPYNLKDRVTFLQNKLIKNANLNKSDIKLKNENNNKKTTMSVNSTNKINNEIMLSLGGILNKNTWNFIIQ
jgi:superfamily II DNA or RNA helicase